MNDLTVKEEEKPLRAIKNGLIAMGDQLTNVLPSHVSQERFVQVVCTAVANSPDLGQVAMTAQGRQSIFIACVQCASDGLIPDGREAALVAFNKNIGTKQQPQWIKLAQYMPMVRGIVNRIQQAGDAREVGVELVYQSEVEGGRFIYRRTQAGVEFHHEPDTFNPKKGEPVGVYANMVTKDGGFYVAVLNADDIENIKASAKSANGPWGGPFAHEMWKKSAIKRLAKLAPVSAEVRRMLDQDSERFHELEPIAEKPKMLQRLQDAKQTLPPPDVDPEPEAPPTGDPDVMEGEVVDPPAAEPEAPALPVLEERVSAAQAIEYAKAWSALYKPLDKASRDALWAQTEEAVTRVGKISTKAEDICNDALNSPTGE